MSCPSRRFSRAAAVESQRRSFLTAAVATALTISAVGFAIVDGVSSYEAPVVADLTPGWDLVWEDEFEGSSLDTTRWNVPVGDGCPELCGWGRGELQYFLDESVSVEGGELVLTADDRFYEHWPFTSGRLRASYAGEWPSGRIEARISAS